MNLLLRASIFLLITIELQLHYATATELFKPIPTAEDLIGMCGFEAVKYTVTCNCVKFDIYKMVVPGESNSTDKPVVMLQPGLACALEIWFLLGLGSLPCVLARAGLTVILSNNRGSKYSSNICYSKEEPDYWDFSFHKMGTEDLPCLTDYILQITNKTQVHFVGQSKANTALLVMLSKMPEQASKFISVTALGIYASFKYASSLLFAAMHVLCGGQAGDMLPSAPFLITPAILHQFGAFFCADKSIAQDVCISLLYTLFGWDPTPASMNTTALELLLQTTPQDISNRDLCAYGQLVYSDKFTAYNYGLVGNVIKYGSIQPPEYDLSLIDIPIHIIYTLNDVQEDVRDIQIMKDRLKNAILLQNPDPSATHLSFVYDKNATYMYEKLVLPIILKAEADRLNGL